MRRLASRYRSHFCQHRRGWFTHSACHHRGGEEPAIVCTELARRMDAPRSVITRITNPFYFGHTSRTLRSVAAALDRQVHLSIDKPNGRGDRRTETPHLVAV